MKQLLALPLLGFLALACSGGSDTPTDPGTPQRRLAISFAIESANNIATLQEAQLLFDGQVISSYSGAATAAVLLQPVLSSVAPGNHTLAIRVERQVATPILYRLGRASGARNSVIVSNATGAVLTTLNFALENLSMATGDSKSYSVQIP
jgi:hypothetical protein